MKRDMRFHFHESLENHSRPRLDTFEVEIKGKLVSLAALLGLVSLMSLNSILCPETSQQPQQAVEGNQTVAYSSMRR